MKYDIEVSNQGTIWFFTPIAAKAKAWVKKNVHLESWQWSGKGFAVDHRFAQDLAQGMSDAGIVIKVV